MQKTYEAMFIVDPLIASKEWNRVSEEIEKIIKRYNGEMVSLKKWGERKLSYPVKKQARGTYVLSYFKTPSESVTPIKNDLQLSEVILRFMLLAHEGEVKETEAPKDFETIGLRTERTHDDRGERREHGGGDRGPGGGMGGHRPRPPETRPATPAAEEQ
jgi:small subunit ribosomal protein S6